MRLGPLSRGRRRADLRPAILRSVALAAGAWTMGCSLRSGCAEDVDGAWEDYQAGAVVEAHEVFERAVAACPGSMRAKLGLAYTAMRQGNLEIASELFESVSRDLPDDPEVLTGIGILRFRTGEFPEARAALRRALEVGSDSELAQAYLARFPVQETTTRRDPFVRPDTLVYPARVDEGGFQIRSASGWAPFYVKGINLGAAIPSLYPSQFPDLEAYETWLPLMAEMGANVVRVYTIHPPEFYVALRDYNLRHPEAPLWLIHGVWAELPPRETAFDHPGWRSGFFREIRSVVDVVHGMADLPLSVARAAGTYTADVSPWTLALILGREWEAHSLVGYNESTPTSGSWQGRYVGIEGGTPIDVWMAQALEEAVSYEARTYNAQRPVAYTNWPPTDPLTHPTETSSDEEQAIRRSFGDSTRFVGETLTGDDVVALDPSTIRPTEALAAGYFAAYHVYPYYPDFMVLEQGLVETASPWGPSNFWGYLTALREYHGDLPILVAEYGIPTSIGIAHLQPQGRHHGGGGELPTARDVAQLTREIEAAGMVGGIVFEWIDEWFKDTWITSSLEVPRANDRLWYNRMDPGEHFGLLAVEPLPALPGAALEDRLTAWSGVPPLVTDPSGIVLRATTDEAYVWLLVEYGVVRGGLEETLVGFDVLDPAGGDFRWPGGVGARLPVGLDFVLRASDEQVRLVVDPPFNPVSLDTLRFVPLEAPVEWPPIGDAPPGMFRGHLAQEPAPFLYPQTNEDGRYEDLNVLANRARFGRDSTEYAAIGYNWGLLPPGPLPDGLWERAPGFLEVRVPWQLLNISDPSRHRVLAYRGLDETPEPGTRTTDGIRLLVGLRTSGDFQHWPVVEDVDDVPLLTWEPWTTPRWTTRLRPSYWLIRDAWAELRPSFIVEE